MATNGADAAWSSASSVGYLFGALGAEGAPGPLLVGLLGDVGVGVDAARTVLARMVRSGQLTSTRRGRVSVYRLAGTFGEQFLRVRRSAAGPPAWPGSFASIVYDIPEHSRAIRDELRALASTHGYGSPRPGLLLGFEAPHWLGRIELPADSFAEPARLQCELEVARRLVAQSWPLAELADRLTRQREAWLSLGAEPVDEPLAAFRRHHQVMSQLARARLTIPALPVELAPTNWPEAAMYEAFRAVSGTVWSGVVQHVAATVAASPHEHLLQHWGHDLDIVVPSA